MIYLISLVAFLAILVLAGLIWFGMKHLDLKGDPASVSKAFSEVINTQAQLIVGVLIVLVITLLMIEKNITAEAGLPIISLVGGYLLGKGINDHKGK